MPFLHAAFEAIKNRLQFLVVYISEAHAADEWPVGHVISSCNQPKTIEDRMENARIFAKKHALRIPMLLDTMANEFQSQFSPWPFRFFVLHRGRVAHKPQPDPHLFGYTHDAMRLAFKAFAI